MDDKDIERWITVKGNHIPVKKGQSEKEAISNFMDRVFDNSDDVEIEVETEDEKKTTKNVIIGIYDKSLTKRGEYRALIGIELI